MLSAPGTASAQGGGTHDDIRELYTMTIGHWTAAVLGAVLLGGCNAQRDDTGTSGGAGGMSSGAPTTTDTTMTGGQGGMADTSMGGMHDTSTTGTTGTGGAARPGADTTRP
jgi:hypothetical protein